MKLRNNENAFTIIAEVTKLLKAADRENEVDEVVSQMMTGDYEHLKQVATEKTFGTITFTEE